MNIIYCECYPSEPDKPPYQQFCKKCGGYARVKTVEVNE